LQIYNPLISIFPPKLKQNQGRLFENSFASFLDPNHRLVFLEQQLDWQWLEKQLTPYYKKGAGYPPIPLRVLTGLSILQYMKNLSDREVVEYFIESFYVQYFCGYLYPQWKAPINPSSLVRFRQRIKDEGANALLQETIRLAIKKKVVTQKELKSVVADTTVMPKNIQHPTDAQLLDQARKNIVKLAEKEGVKLRQNYNRLAKQTLTKIGRYAHAKQFKRMKKSTKKLKNYTGRVVRDVERKTSSNQDLAAKFSPLLGIAKQILTQKKNSKNKIYSIHEPNVYCIAKGKAKTPYEFGCKVSVVCTSKKGLILSSNALEKNIYDGHSLQESLHLSKKMTQIPIKKVFVDKGYKGHKIGDPVVYISGQKRGISQYMRKQMNQRSIVEGVIGTMKEKSKLAKNMLSGVTGDKINAVLCAVAHNLKVIINNNYFNFWRLICTFLLTCYQRCLAYSKNYFVPSYRKLVLNEGVSFLVYKIRI